MGLLDFLSGNNADDISPVTITQKPVGAPSKLNGILGQFGGAGNLGLQMLANSGYSTTPRNFGQIFAQSALNAQQMAAGTQEQQLKQQLLAAQIKALQMKQPQRLIGEANPDKFTPDSLAKYAQSGNPADLVAIAAPVKPLDPLGQLEADHVAGLVSDADYKARRSMLTTREGPGGQLITRPVGEGMVQDYLLDTRTGKQSPTGSPYSAADAKGQSGLGSREGVMFQRVVNSANSATTALQNISELPVGASTGVMGIGASPGHSVMESVKGALLNRVASQEIQDYNTMLAGVSRNLSTIETAGLAPNGSITNSMDSIQLREGDTEITKLRKLAEMRQIIEKGIEPNLANPKLPPEQKQLIRDIVKQAQTAIPFTQHDITELQRRQQANPDMTLQDLIKQKGLGGSIAHVNSDADYVKLPSGAVFIGPDGKQRRKP